VSLPEQVPPDGWTALERAGEEIARVRFAPEGEPPAVAFRVPQSRFLLDLTEQLTVEDLLTAAVVPAARVESWRVGDESHDGLGGANPELQHLLPPPPPDADHLLVCVRLKSPARAGADVPPETWQALDVLWKSILVLEAGIDAPRLGLDGLRAELDGAFKRSLHVDEKVHALQSDVAQWTKAKTRVHHTLPKLREFIHRATWAAGTPERKRLEEVIERHIEPRVPLPDLDHVREQMEHLQKDRQVLAAQGNAVQQEGRAILGEIQRALSTLQRNAADRASKKRSAGREKGKFF
jgi:hypothetical protein